MTAAIPLIIGIADFTWQAGSLTFTGIALGSIAALIIYHGMRLLAFRDASTVADGSQSPGMTLSSPESVEPYNP